ncbi:MAG: GIY-YIG nuclease family protein [Thermodesulfobacteriota bacterium]
MSVYILCHSELVSESLYFTLSIMVQAFAYYVYIMSNTGLTTIYIGVTNNLVRRVIQHKLGKGSKFTNKYKVNRLIYFEEFEDVINAITREKQLKNWHRDWKWNLIKSLNPGLKDLSEGWYDEETLKQVQGDNK